MSMFCFQCQETARNSGCTVRGVCGKMDDTARLQDLLIYLSRRIAFAAEKCSEKEKLSAGRFITKALFATITNANFDNSRISELIKEGISLKTNLSATCPDSFADVIDWNMPESEYATRAESIGVLADSNEDVRSLKQLLILGIKGISAYSHHAEVLGYEKDEIYSFVIEALASTLKELPADKMTEYVLRAGECAVTTMALLHEANSKTYGNKELTEVDLGVRANPGILVSGHDLLDLEELLKQTEGSGVDIYTHSEMLPAHYYPAFKKYSHFAGNYGSSWWHQDKDFDSFNGAILMTTNCIIPVKDAYKDRIFTTGMAGYPGVKHVTDRTSGGQKDFSEVINCAKKCPAPVELEKGKITGGFGIEQLLAVSDKVIENVKNGSIKRFVVMAGCDGRHKEREYFTQTAEALPKDAIILTAGCAKYRYIKTVKDDINGIPRVIDAGQCNDSYSLAVIALKLKEAFGLDDVNKLPLSFDIAWYEQKAVAVLLALLHLGFKGMRLGPTLPAFVSPGVLKVLVENFGIKGTTDAESDVKAMMRGE